MLNLAPDRKAYLLNQHKESQARAQASAATDTKNRFASYGPSSGGSYLPKLVPQLTGGSSSMMKRFSISSFTGWGGPSEDAGSDHSSAVSSATSISTSDTGKSARTEIAPEPEPLIQQLTGGLFGSWWNRPAPTGTSTWSKSSASPLVPDMTGTAEVMHDTGWYVDEMRNL